MKSNKKGLFKKDPLTNFTDDFREAIEKQMPIKHLYAICEAAYGLYSYDLKVDKNLYEIMGSHKFLETIAREGAIFTVKDWLHTHQRKITATGITSKEICQIDNAVHKHIRQRRITGLTPYTFLQVIWAGVATQEQLMEAEPSVLRSMIPTAYNREVSRLRRDLLLARREKCSAVAKD